MLTIKDLEVYYGVIQAIKGVSFEVNQGEVIALIGANGAGKTTILHTITGLLAPKNGSVVFEGKEMTKMPAHKIVSLGKMCIRDSLWAMPSPLREELLVLWREPRAPCCFWCSSSRCTGGS